MRVLPLIKTDDDVENLFSEGSFFFYPPSGLTYSHEPQLNASSLVSPSP